MHTRYFGMLILLLTTTTFALFNSDPVASESDTFVIYFKAKKVDRGFPPVDTLHSTMSITKRIPTVVGGVGGTAVSVTYDNEVKSEFNYNVYYNAEIEYGRDDVDPDDTDSIQLGNHVGYPCPESNVWLFLVKDGRIPIYGFTPSITGYIHYRESDGMLTKFPRKLVNNYAVKTVTGINYSSESSLVANMLSHSPRLYCEYKDDMFASITRFNSLPKEQLLTSLNYQEIAILTQNCFNETDEEQQEILADSLLRMDSTNAYAYIVKARASLKEDQLDRTERFIEKASKYSYEEDYLIFELQGDLHTARSEYRSAYSDYSKAMKYHPNDSDKKDFSNRIQKQLKENMKQLEKEMKRK